MSAIAVAANYSEPLARALQAGQVRLDYLKCFDDDDLVCRSLAVGPTYVHFSLEVGSGKGDAIEAYIGQLPVHRLREVHVSGVVYVGERLQRLAAAAGLPDGAIRHVANRYVDRVPLGGEGLATAALGSGADRRRAMASSLVRGFRVWRRRPALRNHHHPRPGSQPGIAVG